jgi:aconitate hydratase
MTDTGNLSFDPTGSLLVGNKTFKIYRLDALQEQGIVNIGRLPYSIRVLLENLLRSCCQQAATEEDVLALAAWKPGKETSKSIPFVPARVVLQDFTGVPALVDLAALRSAMHRAGGDPDLINPQVPADLVIDHSVQVDHFGSREAFEYNVTREMERNRERYTMLRWGQKAFRDLSVVPPGTGIVHQVNLEYLGKVVQSRQINGDLVAFPDTLVGTDSHTPMINGLGVLGWGVGGIEAEAVLLGQPYHMLIPDVVGMKLTGSLPEGSTATDLVLHITEMLREKGVVGKFVEFFGPGLASLSLPDRATISNMSPEYGATVTFFPVDTETLRFLSATGRPKELVDQVESYTKAQNLFHLDGEADPDYSAVYEVDLGRVEPSLAGPRKPHERVALGDLKDSFVTLLPNILTAGVEIDPDDYEDVGCWADEGGSSMDVPEACACPTDPRTECRCVDYEFGAEKITLSDGSVVIAAITSCTNTSNPSVMMGAGLLAKRAVEKGLRSKPWVKTSMAPGSRVVTDYLDRASPGISRCRLRLHNLYRQQRAAAQIYFEYNRGQSADNSGRSFRKSQLRGAHQPSGQGELPGLTHSGGGLCHSRIGQRRSRQRAHRR